MYARVTPYKMKPGSKAAAMKIMETLKAQILALPGQQTFLNVMNDDSGDGYVVSTTDVAEPLPETVAKIKGLWGAFDEHLVSPPTGVSYDIIADWKS